LTRSAAKLSVDRNITAISDTLGLALLVWTFLILTCASLVLVSGMTSEDFHIRYSDQNVFFASSAVAIFGLVAGLLFAANEFSFGYYASFYFLSITAGYLWLSYFSPLEYDHLQARMSVVACFLAFALPAMIITDLPIRRWTLRQSQVDVLMMIALAGIVLIIGYASHLGFSVSWPIDDALRSQLNYPKWLNYSLAISLTTLAPFAFAWFYQRKLFLLASVALIVEAAIYPVSLNKTALLAPLWMLSSCLLIRLFSTRVSVILSLLLPLILGFLASTVHATQLITGLINFRMLAVPASALDHYLNFFASHPTTHFCQISFIGSLFDCTLVDELGVTMAKEFETGNYNASLFATEGIASVGVLLAPVAAFIAGLIFAIGNASSSGLRPQFVFLSSAILMQFLMNIPLSVLMASHGGLLMFLLWSVCPREPLDRPGQIVS
jgi:hypothetical protein